MVDRNSRKSLPLGRVYRYLEPGPVVLIATAHNKRNNVMAQSWHTMIDFEPPLVGLVLSNRNYSFEAFTKTKECTINIPTLKIAKAVAGCGNTSGRKFDKFRKFGLTPLEAAKVRAPLVKECFANFECKIADTKLADKYNFFVVEVVKAWVDPSVKNPKTIHHTGEGYFMIPGRTIKLPSKMP